jgi:exonuclease SbcD
MRLIHTSDWHLGHTLHEISRRAEHLAFFDWLLGRLQALQADALLVAGDIFDTANPRPRRRPICTAFWRRRASGCRGWTSC